MATKGKKQTAPAKPVITAFEFRWERCPEITDFTIDEKGQPNPNGLAEYKEALINFRDTEAQRIAALMSANPKESVFTPFDAWAKVLVDPKALERISLIGDSTEKEKSGVQSLVVSDSELMVKSVRSFLSEVSSGVHAKSAAGQRGAKGFTHRHKGSIHNIKGDNEAIEVVGFVNLIARDKTGILQRMQDVLIAAVDNVLAGDAFSATEKCYSQAGFTSKTAFPVPVDCFRRIVNAGARARQKNRAMSLLANADTDWQNHQTTVAERAAVKAMSASAGKK